MTGGVTGAATAVKQIPNVGNLLRAELSVTDQVSSQAVKRIPSPTTAAAGSAFIGKPHRFIVKCLFTFRQGYLFYISEKLLGERNRNVIRIFWDLWNRCVLLQRLDLFLIPVKVHWPTA